MVWESTLSDWMSSPGMKDVSDHKRHLILLDRVREWEMNIAVQHLKNSSSKRWHCGVWCCCDGRNSAWRLRVARTATTCFAVW